MTDQALGGGDTSDSTDSDEAENAAASNGHQLQRTLEINVLLPEQMDGLLQGAANLTDAAAREAGEDLLRRLLDEWLAHPQEPAIVGVPDDLLARAADTVITHQEGSHRSSSTCHAEQPCPD